eukprot:6454735-Amphidinium_carterae.3
MFEAVKRYDSSRNCYMTQEGIAFCNCSATSASLQEQLILCTGSWSGWCASGQTLAGNRVERMLLVGSGASRTSSLVHSGTPLP